jgi:hypothetical protein
MHLHQSPVAPLVWQLLGASVLTWRSISAARSLLARSEALSPCAGKQLDSMKMEVVSEAAEKQHDSAAAKACRPLGGVAVATAIRASLTQAAISLDAFCGRHLPIVIMYVPVQT